MVDPWYIYGAGGFGTETMDILQHAIEIGAIPEYEGRYIDDSTTHSRSGKFTVRKIQDCAPGSKVTIAVGEPVLRAILLEKVEAAGLELSSLISPSAYVSPLSEIAEGVIIAPFCSVQANATVARNAAVNTMAIVGHDVSVGTGAVISSMVNLGGSVEIGNGSYLGMGALVKEGLAIGAMSIVGMGSVVYRDIPDGVIALGNPARVVRKNEDQRVFKGN